MPAARAFLLLVDEFGCIRTALGRQKAEKFEDI
jgi:hypothetical protein